MNKYKLYYLTSEIDDMLPKYVGYTSLTIEERLKHHIFDAKYEKCKSHKVNWIKKVIKNGFLPIIKEIKSVETIEDALLMEMYYVSEYNKLYKLTNSTSGGELSKSFTDDVKNKISNSLKEYYNVNETWNKGLRYKFSEERNLKRRLKMGNKISGENNHFYGRTHSDETKKKLRDKNKIYNYSYSLIFNLYLVENLTCVEISKKLEIPDRVISKAIRKYDLVKVKKEIYGKIKGYKPIVENIDFMKYYNKNGNRCNVFSRSL